MLVLLYGVDVGIVISRVCYGAAVFDVVSDDVAIVDITVCTGCCTNIDVVVYVVWCCCFS